MDNLVQYVLQNTERGECKCGKCIDVGTKPDPNGHTVDLCFFLVAKRGEPDKEKFVEMTKAHRGAFGEVDPLDGKEHNYMQLGGWIGDQGIAMQYMGLGTILGVFNLLTPKTMLQLEGEEAMQLAGMGLLSVQKKVSVEA